MTISLRAWCLAASFLATLAAVCGCAGRSAQPPRPPAERTVVSLVPSVTETLFALGQGGRILGRSRYCNYPPEAQRLPVLGDALDLNLEKVIALKPDIVIFNTANAEFYDRLSSAGIHCLAPRMETVDDVYAVIGLLGRELGCGDRAANLAAELRGQLADVGLASRDATAVPTLVTFPDTLGGGSELRVVGRGTFVDELLTLAGGRNVVPSDGYPRVNVETVVRWAPELIIISAPGDIAPGLTDEEYRRAWSRWGAIPAVGRGRVVVLRQAYLTLPGPRMGQAARLLLETVHPELPARDAARASGPAHDAAGASGQAHDAAGASGQAEAPPGKVEAAKP